MHSHINFAYPWYLTYGHLVIAVPALALCLAGYFWKWSKVLLVPIAAIALWSSACFLLARFALDVNGRLPLPTQSFLPQGSGKVLDMGAGSGRSSLMVLEARPQTTVVALDRFSDEYVRHFGAAGNGQEVLDAGRQRLLSNFRAAGVESRASIQAGDMRQLPFEPATFDGVVSTYAIDHLHRAGIVSSLSEANRVLKPRGEFLLMVISNDVCLNLTFGPMMMHKHTRTAARWAELLHNAGFEIMEQGTRPATLFFLARKT